MLPRKKYTPEAVLAIAWRYKWLIVIPFFLVTIGTIAASRLLPDRYRSQAVILVVPQRVPESYVRSTVTMRIEDRLQALRQQILTRTALEVVIRELDLYRDLRRRLPMEDVYEAMLKDVEIQAVRGDAFRVSYTSGDPQVAKKVAERLAGQFNNQNSQERASQAEATTQFLNSQLRDARDRLVKTEQTLAEYKRQHAGELPSERQSNLQGLSNTQLQVQALEESINRDRDQRMFYQQQIADLEAESAAPAPPEPPPVAGDPTAVGTAAARLEAARNALRLMELRLKPAHPDIIRMKSLIKELEAKAQAEELERPLSRGAAPPRPATPEEAARQNRLRALRAQVEALDIQLKSKQEQSQRLRDSMGTFQARLQAAPIRESELTSLTRDYETTRNTYDTLLARQQESQLSANLELQQAGEQFRTIDPPRVPERPFSPNRQLINLVGALAGLGLGFGLAAFMEYRDTTLRSDNDVVSTLSLPVLAMVPLMLTSSERRRMRRRRFLWSLAAAASVLLVVAAAVAWRLGMIPGLNR